MQPQRSNGNTDGASSAAAAPAAGGGGGGSDGSGGSPACALLAWAHAALCEGPPGRVLPAPTSLRHWYLLMPVRGTRDGRGRRSNAMRSNALITMMMTTRAYLTNGGAVNWIAAHERLLCGVEGTRSSREPATRPGPPIIPLCGPLCDCVHLATGAKRISVGECRQSPHARLLGAGRRRLLPAAPGGVQVRCSIAVKQFVP